MSLVFIDQTRLFMCGDLHTTKVMIYDYARQQSTARASMNQARDTHAIALVNN
jgi:hypothetical protein